MALCPVRCASFFLINLVHVNNVNIIHIIWISNRFTEDGIHSLSVMFS